MEKNECTDCDIALVTDDEIEKGCCPTCEARDIFESAAYDRAGNR